LTAVLLSFADIRASRFVALWLGLAAALKIYPALLIRELSVKMRKEDGG
jgi:hypothetical protein